MVASVVWVGVVKFCDCCLLLSLLSWLFARAFAVGLGDCCGLAGYVCGCGVASCVLSLSVILAFTFVVFVVLMRCGWWLV